MSNQLRSYINQISSFSMITILPSKIKKKQKLFLLKMECFNYLLYLIMMV